MNIKQKALILDSFAKVEGNNIVALGLKAFVMEAHLQTDLQVMEAVLNLQSQAMDHKDSIKRILGKQYKFLMSQRFSSELEAA